MLTGFLPTDLMVKVRVNTLACQKYNRAVKPCHRDITVNLVPPEPLGIIDSSATLLAHEGQIFSPSLLVPHERDLFC